MWAAAAVYLPPRAEVTADTDTRKMGITILNGPDENQSHFGECGPILWWRMSPGYCRNTKHGVLSGIRFVFLCL